MKLLFSLILLSLSIICTISVHNQMRKSLKIQSGSTQSFPKPGWWWIRSKFAQWTSMKVVFKNITNPEDNGLEVKIKMAINRQGLLLHDCSKSKAIREGRSMQDLIPHIIKNYLLSGNQGKYLLLFRLVEQCSFGAESKGYSFHIRAFEGTNIKDVFLVNFKIHKTNIKILDFVRNQMINNVQVANHLENNCKENQNQLINKFKTFVKAQFTYFKINNIFEDTQYFLRLFQHDFLNQVSPYKNVIQQNQIINLRRLEQKIQSKELCDQLDQIYVARVNKDGKYEKKSLKEMLDENIILGREKDFTICSSKTFNWIYEFIWKPKKRVGKYLREFQNSIINHIGDYLLRPRAIQQQRLKRISKDKSHNLEQGKIQKNSQSKGIWWFLSNYIDTWLLMEVQIKKNNGVLHSFTAKLQLTKNGINFYSTDNFEKKIEEEPIFWKKYIVQNLQLIDNQFYFLDFQQIEECQFKLSEDGYEFTANPKSFLFEKQSKKRWKYIIKPLQQGYLQSSWNKIKAYFVSPQDNIDQIQGKCMHRINDITTTLNKFITTIHGFYTFSKVKQGSQAILDESKKDLKKYLYPNIDDVENQGYIFLDQLNTLLDNEAFCEQMQSLVLNNVFNWANSITGKNVVNEIAMTYFRQNLCEDKKKMGNKFIDIPLKVYQEIWPEFTQDVITKISNAFRSGMYKHLIEELDENDKMRSQIQENFEKLQEMVNSIKEN